jgi:hypothetical protein
VRDAADLPPELVEVDPAIAISVGLVQQRLELGLARAVPELAQDLARGDTVI